MRPPFLVSALVALLLRAAPPAAAQVPTGERTEAHPPRLGEFLDTAAVRVALAARPAFPDSGRAARILTVSFDTLGQVSRVRPLVEPAMPAPARDTLVALVSAHLRPIAPRPRGWETHLLLGAGPDARVEETAIARRSPALADRGQFTRRLEREADRLIATHETLPPELRVRLRLTISAEGVVEAHSVLESSGRPDVDEAAIRVVRPSLFIPGAIEGHAVRSQVILPLRFVFPE